MEILFSVFGCTVLRDRNRHFIRYDNGDLVVNLVQNEINAAEVEKIRISQKDAYEVILEAEKRTLPKRVTSG